MIRSSYTFLILVMVLCSCEQETMDEPTCPFSQETEALYSEDARRLLFREIMTNPDHPERNNPWFKQEEMDLLLGAFQSVVDSDTPGTDTVISIHQIHTFPLYGLSSISLKVDPEADPIRQLIRGEPISDPSLAGVIAEYGFNQVDTSLFYPDFNWMTISTQNSLNLLPIQEKLQSLDYIYVAENGGGAIGDGNDIQLERLGNTLRLDFSIGWGDCPAGCIHHRHWIFEVSNCTAEMVSSYSD